MTPKKKTLAELHLNPGNVKTQKWKGEIGKDEKGHAKFDTLPNGCRALFRTLQQKMTNPTYPKDTIELIIAGHPMMGGDDGWAPASDGNKVEAYVDFLSKYMDIPKDQPLQIFGLYTSVLITPKIPILLDLAAGITRYESGKDWVPLSALLIGLGEFHKDFIEKKGKK